ncbi:MAG TPA: MCE family protein [Verrucomicrobia bacterium]|nr:MCE family protein [Verrucomicrobiota bacterium]HOP98063.1 MlaD family protein [Verrucomicrobiota bacterium]
MSKSRLETKVGLFVLIGLVLLAVLVLQFSKGTSFFRPTMNIHLSTTSAGGLRKNADVLMSGVKVGTVGDIRLSPAGTNVWITLKIYHEFVIRDDAKFYIKQSGFLGDNYVDINPGLNQGQPLTNNATALAQEPFDLQEVARSAAGFVRRVDEAATKLNDAIADVRRLVLNEQTLRDLSATVSTMREASEQAVDTLDAIESLFATNGPAVSQSASNLVVASEELNRFASAVNLVLATNAENLAVSMKNIETSTEMLKTLLADVQAGKGLAGTLLHNEEMAANVAQIAENLSITTSNLNRLGLWRGVLFPKKPRDEPAPGRKLTTPGSPFD